MNKGVLDLFEKKEKLQSLKKQLIGKNEFVKVDVVAVEIDEVVDKLSEAFAQNNKDIIKEYMEKDKDGIYGHNQTRTWKWRKKLCPKDTFDPPAAKKDSEGNLITSRKSLETLYLNTYAERMKPNDVAEGFEDPWRMEELENVLMNLKNGKA